MVFGFFEGKVEMTLGKTNFAFGETVSGKVSLKLKKAKQARQFKVTLLGVREITTYGRDSKGRSTRNKRNETIYSTEAILDGEKLYSPPGGEYEFSLQLPQKTALPTQQKIEGAAGTAFTAFQMLSGTGMSSQDKWVVSAVLDIPKGIDMSKKLQISVQ